MTMRWYVCFCFLLLPANLIRVDLRKTDAVVAARATHAVVSARADSIALHIESENDTDKEVQALDLEVYAQLEKPRTLRATMGNVTTAAAYSMSGDVHSFVNDFPRVDQGFHFSFATQLGTELGYAFPVMLSLARKGHTVTLCARTVHSPYHSITPGISQNLINKLTAGGVKVVMPDHDKDINVWWVENYESKVDLFVEDLLTIDVAKPPTMMVAEATNSPISIWSGNTWLLWKRIEKGIFPPPLPNKLYPSFVASWHGTWEPSPEFQEKGVREPDFAEPDGERRWRAVGDAGARVAYVRASVSAVGAVNPDEQIELDKIAAAVARKPDSKIVLFVLGTQGSQLTFEGYKRVVEDLSKFDSICVFVLVKPTGWKGDWANTIQPDKNREITQAWKEWYMLGGGSVPDNFILTTFVPQPQVLSKFGDRAIMISGMGASSLAEAIDAEVPIVGFPVQADQPENSRLVQELQVGLNRSAFVTELWEAGNVQKPYGRYGAIWRVLVGEKHVTNVQLRDLGTDLSAALGYISSNWEMFKSNIRQMKANLAQLTFSQEEVANQYIKMLQDDQIGITKGRKSRGSTSQGSKSRSQQASSAV